ncbi:MAG: alkaline phosphatase family protein [Thermoanaerobaculia bacterium]
MIRLTSSACHRAIAALLTFLFATLPATADARKEPVKLAVILAIDGLSWPTLERYRPWLSQGLARLLDEGQVETAAHYAHLNTETGPGHASLGTGTPPRIHGIVANRWFETDPSGAIRRFYCTDQPDVGRVPGQPPLFYREIERDGRLYVFARQRVLESWEESGELGTEATTQIGEGPKAETLVFDSDDAIYLYKLRRGLPAELTPAGIIPGPKNLRVKTLGDLLVESSPRSQVVALSGKDRGSIFLAGRNPRHLVYWYDRATGRFITSAAYDSDGIRGTQMKTLVRNFNGMMAGTHLLRRFGKIWSRVPAPAGAEALPQPEPDLSKFQMPDIGLGFDHDLSLSPAGYFDAFYYSALQDELLADLTLAVLADPSLALGRRGVPDILALSFSANDTVSHNYGAESEEQLDTLRRLDSQIGRVLSALDSIAKDGSSGRVVLALSSDHGFSPLPEVVRRRSGIRSGGRVTGNDKEPTSAYPSFDERLSRALTDELCLPQGSLPIKGSEGWGLTYDHGIFPALSVEGPCGAADRTITTANVDRVLPVVIRRLYGEEIERVLLVSQKDDWDRSDPAVGFALNDFDAARSGDALLVPKENVLTIWDASRGSGHGSHHAYDTNVPLIFWGGPFGPVSMSRPASPYDLAPTLGDILGVAMPDAVGTSLAPASSSPPAKKRR